jgi:hypothetical protein
MEQTIVLCDTCKTQQADPQGWYRIIDGKRPGSGGEALILQPHGPSQSHQPKYHYCSFECLVAGLQALIQKWAPAAAKHKKK